ncbi:MAG: hypothetical protein ACRD9S_25350, partial [Pyrinomonadaceae bacterium]
LWTKIFKKNKFAALITLAILVGGMFSGAVAQKRMSPAPVDPPSPTVQNGIYKVSVDADELSPGVTDLSGQLTYGWTWSGKTEGDLSGFIFLSLNCAGGISAADQAGYAVGGTSKVMGGSWSKLIFIKDKYVGSISGTIVGGELVWSEKARIATVNLELTADEGTDLFAGNVGTGTLEGIMDQTTRVPSLTGTLLLNY